MSAWSKIWQNIGWQNKPSRLTPLGKSNLDKLDTFNDAIDDRVVEIYNMKGSNNGLAELDANGFVPSTQLPSFVDDIIEGEAQNVTQESSGMFSATGFIKAGESSQTTLESNKVYLDTLRRIQFRWTGTGSNLVSIGSGLTLGETQFTAYRGDRGKTAYDHATDASRNTTTQQVGLYKFGVTSEGHVSSPTEMTAEDLQNAVGLGDVAFISTPENPTQVKYLREDGMWDVPEGQSVVGTQTVKGNPITLTDASETYAQGLTVELEPKQDLHGYDFPWVGGADDNIFDPSLLDDSQGTWMYKTITLKPNTYYTMSTPDCPSYYSDNTNPRLYFLSSIGGAGSNNIVTTSQSVTQLSNSQGVVKIQFTTEDVSKKLTSYHFQLEEGQTATPFKPYENICPITGYTEVWVDDVGKNLFGLTIEDFSNPIEYGLASFVKVDLPNGQYTLSTNAPTGYLWWGNWNGSVFEDNRRVYSGNPCTFTVDNNTTILIGVVTDNKQAALAYHNQLEKGNQATPFEPHHSSNATIQFGQTVYGGSVDLTTGVLTVDKATQTITSVSDRVGVYQFYSSALQGAKQTSYTVEDATSNEIPYNKSSYGSNVFGFATNNGSLYIRLPFLESDTKEAANTFLTANPLQVCYPIAETLTIQLTPQELKLLQGTNNLTTNGTTITLDYIPNNSIGDAVKASEEYTDRAVETKGGVQKTVIFDDLVRIADEITLSLPSSYNFIVFEVNYMYDGATGSAIYSSLIDSINIPANYSGTSHWMELRKAGDIVSVRGDTDIDQGGALLKITVF